MSKVLELFGLTTQTQAEETPVDWQQIVTQQFCPYLNRTCLKVRKSAPDVAIGTCAVRYGRQS